jgi:cell division protein ZapA (FtsZ GTPase activity inhibitor)
LRVKTQQKVLKVLDQKLSVRTEAGDEHISAVEALVNERLRQVLDKNKTASTLSAALLVCLNIADELLTQKNAVKENKQKAAARVRDIIDLVDTCLVQEVSPESDVSEEEILASEARF